MSHELRTPLNSIIGFSNILLKNRDGRLAASDLSFLGRILANGKHLLDLINQILDLSKIEARKIEVLWSSVDVGQLVRQTLEQQEGLVRDRPVQLRAELPPDLAPMRSDPDKLKQILINLIGNALKFTEQGSVTVRVLADPQTRQPRRLDVVDTGLGIPADKLGVIFQAFQQADATTARRFGGTGLGLTISQALCHLLGYRIEVTSEVGKGSSFSVVLSPPPGPAVNEPTASLPPPRDDVTPDGVHAPEIKGKRVLIIDDEADSRLLLRHMLREFGAEVFEAAAGVDGLRLARQVRPDLITVDLMMPGMTGAEVVGAIKGDPELREIPVVVVSIVSREQRGSILGVVDLLQKPIVREELLAALQRNLRPSQHRLLVVDDEADARVLMHSLLEAEHYHVLTAGSGREAWEILHRLPCDLVLLDLMMPETDGFTFLKQLRSDPGYRRVPVVVVTAKELTRQEIDELKGGASDVLQKSAALEQELKEVLHRIFAEPPGKASAASGPRSAGQPSGGS
jgi:CheY-like chemotaxis protein